jgi:hypothetical protein
LKEFFLFMCIMMKAHEKSNSINIQDSFPIHSKDF